MTSDQAGTLATRAHWISICTSCGSPTGARWISYDLLHEKVWCDDCSRKMIYAIDNIEPGEA